MHRPLADQRVRAKHGPMTGSCEAIQNASAVTVWIASAFTLSLGGRVVACAPRNDENKKPGLSAGLPIIPHFVFQAASSQARSLAGTNPLCFDNPGRGQWTRGFVTGARIERRRAAC